MKKLLITGASGFIGGFIVEEALKSGYEVYVSLRKTSSRKYLSDPRINVIELNLNDGDSLDLQIKELKSEKGNFDYVIHNAGITKAKKNQDYFDVNAGITKRLVDSLINNQFVSEKFLFVSSLAAAGPGSEDSDEQIAIDQEPRPVTSYGKSKLEAERYLQSTSDFPYLILRPTAVFGPRDTELYTLFSLIAKNFEFYIGTDKQRLSFIYVKDLVKMLLGALESKEVGKTYFISDGESYLIRDFVDMIKTSMAKKTLKVKVPVFIVSAVAFILEKSLGVFGQIPALNSEKMAELTSQNWTCDMTPFFKDISLRPKYDLPSAVAETVEWYKKENWI